MKIQTCLNNIQYANPAMNNIPKTVIANEHEAPSCSTLSDWQMPAPMIGGIVLTNARGHPNRTTGGTPETHGDNGKHRA